MEALIALKKCLEEGFITNEEYELRKRQVIDNLTNTKITEERMDVAGESRGQKRNREEDAKQPPMPAKIVGGEDPVVLPLAQDGKAMKMEEIPKSTTPKTKRRKLHESQSGGDKRGEMGLDLKYQLSQTISSGLPDHCLRQVLNIVREHAPRSLRMSGEDWTFDLAHLPSPTLWRLHDFVYQELEKLNREENKEGGAQGEEKQTLAASVYASEDDEDEFDEEEQQDNEDDEADDDDDYQEEEDEDEEEEEDDDADDDYAQTRSKGAKRPRSGSNPAIGRSIKRPRSASGGKGKEKQAQHAQQQRRRRDPKSHNNNNVARTNEGGPFKIQVVIYSLSKQRPGTSHPYVCGACCKAFKDRSNLTQHLRVHTKEKPFVCAFPGCHKRFAHSASLKEHAYTHEGKKPHTCDICGRSFAQASNLRRHQRVHTGERPYVCPVDPCGKCFSQKSNLLQHVKRSHKGVTLPADYAPEQLPLLSEAGDDDGSGGGGTGSAPLSKADGGMRIFAV